MRPPFSYYGGKVGLARQLVALLPPHRVYIEPFFGSGAVFFAKRPSQHEIINDVDDAIVNFFRVLRDRTNELERACALSPYARSEFATDIDEPGLADIERARRFWVRVNQSFGHSASNRTGWSITTARTQGSPASVRSRLGRFEAVATRLLDATIESRDAVDLIDSLATDDTVIYADPPYLGSTRRGKEQGNRRDYRHDAGTEDFHRTLAVSLNATPAVVVLSGYPSPLYDDLYADWSYIDIAVTAHSSNARTKSRTGRTERIWRNRPIEPDLTLWTQ